MDNYGSFYPDTVPEHQFFQGNKAIGPCFNDELLAHGELVPGHYTQIVPGLFGATVTLEFFDDTPQSVIDWVLAVYEAHDPTKPGQAEQP